MGSFTEVVLAVEFRSDVPPEVLGAFARFNDGRTAIPALPERPKDDFDEEELDDEEFDETADFSSLSSVELAYLWSSTFNDYPCAYFPGHPNVVLRHDGRRWTLTARFFAKTYAEPVCALLAPLGRFTFPHAATDNPTFVGYLKFEADDRPVLIWHRGSQLLEFEDSRLHPSVG